MKPRVLIVEDEPGIADTLQYALRTEGFEPAWCATGEEALVRIGSEAPALVILDVGLPDASGFEVFKRIRATRRAASWPRHAEERARRRRRGRSFAAARRREVGRGSTPARTLQ